MAGDRGAYIGPRLRRLRRDLGLTQGGMAGDLAVSVSYVSLLESNQRPVTADMLLKLARTYKIDLSDLAGDGGAEFAARLQSGLRDPLFADIDLPALQTADVASNYPGITEAFLRLHTAYRQEQLALADRHADPGGPAIDDPVGAVRRFQAARRNSFPDLDDASEKLAGAIEEAGGFAPYLKARHGLRVRIMDARMLGGMIRRYDPHHAAIFLDDALAETERRFQLAVQIAYLELSPMLDALIAGGGFGGENAVRLARRALASHAAAAMLMPFARFAAAAEDKRYDVAALARRFGVSFEQAAHRLTTLHRVGSDPVRFGLIRVDPAGIVSKRLDATGRSFALHGGGCSLWSLHHVFRHPGQVVTQYLSLPDGDQLFSIARTVASGGGGHGVPVVERALALVCTADQAGRTVYADPALSTAPAVPTPIGITCTLCHRDACTARALPPIGRPILADNFYRGHAPFGFADD